MGTVELLWNLEKPWTLTDAHLESMCISCMIFTVLRGAFHQCSTRPISEAISMKPFGLALRCMCQVFLGSKGLIPIHIERVRGCRCGSGWNTTWRHCVLWYSYSMFCLKVFGYNKLHHIVVYVVLYNYIYIMVISKIKQIYLSIVTLSLLVALFPKLP